MYDGPVSGDPEDAPAASISRDRWAFQRIGDAGERVPGEQGRFQWVPVDDQDVPGLLPVRPGEVGQHAVHHDSDKRVVHEDDQRTVGDRIIRRVGQVCSYVTAAARPAADGDVLLGDGVQGWCELDPANLAEGELGGDQQRAPLPQPRSMKVYCGKSILRAAICSRNRSGSTVS